MVNVNETIAAFEGLITRPVLKANLLEKPPFRFLHDIITNLQKSCNFPPTDSFYDGELNSENVKEKDSKIAFLDKAILATQIATGETVDVKPNKIVAGLEFENTNLWLISMAAAARNVSNLDLKSISNKVKATYPPPGGAPPAEEQQKPSSRPSSGSEAVPAVDNRLEQERAAAAAAETARQAALAASEEEDARIRREMQREAEMKREAEAKKSKEIERQELEEAEIERGKKAEERQRAVDHEEKPKAVIHEEKTSTPIPPRAPSPNRAEETSAVAVAPKARRSSGGSLGFPVTRAVIALSSDPPGEDVYEKTIRLLGAVIQKPKLTVKLLSKPPFRFIHDVVTSCLRSSGFPDGLYKDFELDSKNLESAEAKFNFLKKLIDCLSVATGDGSLAANVQPKKILAGLESELTNHVLVALARSCASGIDSAKVMEAMKKGPVPAAKREEESAPKLAAKKDPVKGPSMPKLPLNDVKKEDDKVVYNAGDALDVPGKLARPKTARRAPPKLRSNIIEDGKKEGDEAADAPGVILDGHAPEEIEEEEAEDEVLQGFEDPVDNGQHGKLVTDILKAQKKEKPKEDEKDPKFGFARLPSAKRAMQNQNNAKNIQELRQKIQKICQSANPLGKIIDFVYEDMETMNKELHKWRAAHQANIEKFEEEKHLSLAQLEPLTTKLANVTAQVEEQRKKVVACKASILRNESVLMQLLEQHAAPD